MIKMVVIFELLARDDLESAKAVFLWRGSIEVRSTRSLYHWEKGKVMIRNAILDLA